MLTLSDLRPEVAAFALAMEKQLRSSNHKPGWKDDSAEVLCVRANDGLIDLGDIAEDFAMGDPDGPVYSLECALKKAADVANFCMMVADVLGALETEDSDAGHSTTDMLDSKPSTLEDAVYAMGVWKETAARHATNEELYRNLLYKVAEHLGPEVFVSDDGSIQDHPLALKIPGLVGELKREAFLAGARTYFTEDPLARKHQESSLTTVWRKWSGLLKHIPDETDECPPWCEACRAERAERRKEKKEVASVGYTPCRPFAAEGARVGIVTCLRCGAALLLDPADKLDIVKLHDAWHAQRGS